MGRTAFAEVNKVLSGHFVAIGFFKGVQRGDADGVIIGGPIREAVGKPRILAPDPDKVIKQGCEPDDVRLRMLLAPGPHPPAQIILRFGIPGIQLHQMLPVSPVVGQVVIHGNLFPDPVDEEIHRVGMIRDALADTDAAVLIGPLRIGKQDACRPVIDLPTPQRTGGEIQLELIPAVALQERNDEPFSFGNDRLAHQHGLLPAVGVLPDPCVVFPNWADGGIDRETAAKNLLGERGAVAVPNGVGTPFFCKR